MLKEFTNFVSSLTPSLPQAAATTQLNSGISLTPTNHHPQASSVASQVVNPAGASVYHPLGIQQIPLQNLTYLEPAKTIYLGCLFLP